MRTGIIVCVIVVGATALRLIILGAITTPVVLTTMDLAVLVSATLTVAGLLATRHTAGQPQWHGTHQWQGPPMPASAAPSAAHPASLASPDSYGAPPAPAVVRPPHWSPAPPAATPALMSTPSLSSAQFTCDSDRAAAYHPDTPPEVLAEIADRRPDLKAIIATNPNAPADPTHRSPHHGYPGLPS